MLERISPTNHQPQRTQNKRVQASLEKSQAEGISEKFAEMERRNPDGQRQSRHPR
jgi:hypothetical protein